MQEEPTDEQDFITWVEQMIDTKDNLLGHREDAIAIQKGQDIMVINIDGWVASSDRPKGMTAHQVGYRAVANAVSDVIVKGAIPEGMIISSSIDAKYKSELKQIIAGFKQASHDFSTPFFGGDMNSSTDLVIDVTVWGRCQQLVRRDGAQIGDDVYWLGPPLGCTAAALGILTKEWIGEKSQALEVMGYPQLFPEFLEIDANAAVDSSDGVARSLYLIADASKVRIELQELPDTAEWIKNVARQNQVDLIDLYLYGGEELGIVFSCTPSSEIPDHSQYLGRVTEGKGVYLKGKRIPNRGWDHLLSLD